jgi:hypothetical protein
MLIVQPAVREVLAMLPTTTPNRRDRDGMMVRYALRLGRAAPDVRELFIQRLMPAELVASVGVDAAVGQARVASERDPVVLEKLRGAGLDFVLDLSDQPPSASLAGVARFGLWFFRDEVEAPPSRLGEAAFVAGQRSAVVRLLAADRNGAIGLIEEGALRVRPQSAAATRHYLLRWLADWPARHARALALGAPVVRTPVAPPGPPPPSPGPWRRWRAALRNSAAQLAAEAVEEQWTLGVIEHPVDDLLRGLDVRSVTWLPELRGGFLADPMMLPVAGGPLTVLAEAYWFAKGSSTIVAATLDGAHLSEPREVLRLPEALSYPYLIEHEGRIYCLPEANATARVQLYRADPFPERWLPDRVLLDGFPGVDATLFRHGGRFWILATDQDGEPKARLHAFWAEELFGPWTPHPLNPVRTDVRSSRPAGPVFHHDGALYRPAQDCSQTYGGAVTLNRIDRLSLTEFAESVVARLEPDPDGPYPDGLHTLSGAGGITIIDGKRHFFSPRRLVRHVGRAARQHMSRKIPRWRRQVDAGGGGGVP